MNPHIEAADQFLDYIKDYIHIAVQAYMAKHQLFNAIVGGGRRWCDGDETPLNIYAWVPGEPFNYRSYSEYLETSDISVPFEFGRPTLHQEFLNDVYTLYPLFAILFPDKFSGDSMFYWYKQDDFIKLNLDVPYEDSTVSFNHAEYSQGKYKQF